MVWGTFIPQNVPKKVVSGMHLEILRSSGDMIFLKIAAA